MRKALMSTTVAACGIFGAVFATGVQAGRVAVSVNIVAPVSPGVVIGAGYHGGGYYGGVPVVAQPVFVVPQRRVFVAPVVVVPVVRFGGYGHHRHHRHHFRNDFRGRGYGNGYGNGYRY